MAKLIAEWVTGDKVISVTKPDEWSSNHRVSLMHDVKFGRNGTREGTEVSNTQERNEKEAMAKAASLLLSDGGTDWKCLVTPYS